MFLHSNDSEDGNYCLCQEYSGTIDQNHKETIVVKSHTITQPRTMMVEPQHAIVAERAMLGSWRPVHTACHAPLLLDCDLVYPQEPGSRAAIGEKLDLWKLVLSELLLGSWHNAWICERRQDKGYANNGSEDLAGSSKKAIPFWRLAQGLWQDPLHVEDAGAKCQTNC